jgi:two-component system, LytTR family, sensor histidine kinase AlgZ
MHPILSQFRRLVLYLTGWIPVALLLTYFLALPGGLTWRESAILSFPLCFVYAFACLSAWFSCRSLPLDTTDVSKLLATHATAALVSSGFWVLTAWMLAHVLSYTGRYPGLSARLPHELGLLFGTGILLYSLSVGFYYTLLALEASREAEARVMQASVLARDAVLKALKAQVNPHFLFNSLNSISALTSSSPAKAREMCVLLGDFLRKTLGLGAKAAIPLDEELALIRGFLAIEKVRFGQRLRVEENVEQAAGQVLVPPLLLQPLVENSVAHGIANLPEGGCIRLIVRRENGFLGMVVENNFDPEAPSSRSSGVGLVNVRQRLEAHYGKRASFVVTKDGASFRAAIQVPLDTGAGPKS